MHTELRDTKKTVMGKASFALQIVRAKKAIRINEVQIVTKSRCFFAIAIGYTENTTAGSKWARE
jgi:hypothetical protein